MAKLRTVLLAGVLTLPAARADAFRWLSPAPADEIEQSVAQRPSQLPRSASEGVASETMSTAAALAASLVRSSTALATNLARGSYDAAAGLVDYGRGGIWRIVDATGNTAWEAAYALGINRTPAANLPVEDPAPPDRLGVAASLPAELPLPPVATRPPNVEAQLAPPAAVPDDTGLLENFVYDQASRQPNGTMFVPKALQRLFGLRTQRVTTSAVPISAALAGRIVPDPQTHGHVEASLIGRITAPPTGLPVLGEKVTKDQVLAFVTPSIGLVERVQMQREVARLGSEIRVEAENVERLTQFSFVPFRDGKIYQSQTRIDGLRRERAALLAMVDTQEVLRAPTTGVVSFTQAIEGAIMEPGKVIFDIVDPKRLWIEAMAPDPTIAQSVSKIVAASARTPEGVVLQVSFVGSGLALRQQATPMLFRINRPPAGLRLDRPVTVTIEGEVVLHGIPIPRGALTATPDGVPGVWEQVAPEYFQSHPVQTRDIDGEQVLVVAGLADGTRVVVGGGVRLMAQLQ
jgi:hypothetical protein